MRPFAMLRRIEDPHGNGELGRRRSSIGMQVAVGTALLALLATAGASAAVPGYERVDAYAPFPNTSAPSQLAYATCPSGKRVLGAGGAIRYGAPGPGPIGQIALKQLVPNVAVGPELQGASIQAHEQPGGTTLNWGLDVQAICADPLPGEEFVLTSSPSGPAPFGFKKIYDTQATCRSGKRLVGAGAAIMDGSGVPTRGDVRITDVTPNATLTGVSVVALEKQDDLALNWSLTAWLICADAPLFLKRVATTEHVTSYGYRLARAYCPKGTKVLSAAGALTAPSGLGGDLAGGGGTIDRVTFNSGPYFAEGVTVAARQAGGGRVDDRWIPRAYAICAAV